MTNSDAASTAAGRYTQLEALRSPTLLRARECAVLTIPSLMPPQGHSTSTKLPTPFQGIGARGTNNLASKLLLALFPPNSPFFRMEVDDFTLEKITKQGGMRAEVEKALARVERAVMTHIEQEAIRVSAFEALKQLIIAGNCLCYLPPEGGMKVFRLDRYVVSRDPMGNPLEIIVREDVSPDVLSKLFAKLDISDVGGTSSTDGEAPDGSAEKTVAIYTHVYFEDDKWNIYQEVNGERVDGTKGTYPKDKSPWLPLRWTSLDGEDYGRGYVEEYLGDLKSLEALTQAIVEGSAAAAKVVFLVNPNGTTNMKTIADAPNGAVRSGNSADVTVLQMEKQADFQVAMKALEMIQERMSFAFMLNSSVQRAAERVTAEEIRFMAGELEDALGGIYSILSQEFQLPLVKRILLVETKRGKLPPLPKEVQPTITTGLEALGRGHDLNKLQAFMQAIQVLGPQVIAQYLNVSNFFDRVGTSLGIDTDGLLKSDEEVQQAQQQAQQQQSMQGLAEKLGPSGIKAISDHVMAGRQGTQNGPSPTPQGGPQQPPGQ